MLSSSTCTVTFIWVRSAIWMSGPLLAPCIWEAPPTLAPTWAFIATTLPSNGAVTVRLAPSATAWS